MSNEQSQSPVISLSDDSSITSFPATTLSTNDFRWLAHTDWADADTEYFSTNRWKQPNSFLASSKFFTKREQPHLISAARWVLNPFPDVNQQCGWAEVQVIEGSFRIAFLLLAVEDKVFRFKSIAHMVSATLILGEPDLLRVFSVMDGKEVRTLGTPKTIFTLQGAMAGLPVEKTVQERQLVDIEPASWWTSPPGRESFKELSYLHVRMRRSKRHGPNTCG